MSSAKQIAANRANAAKSGGPKTLLGKARAKRNALRHGLTIPIGRNPAVAAMIAEFACELVGNEAPQIEMDLARAAAEGQFDIARIREQRDHIFDRDVVKHVSPRPGRFENLIVARPLRATRQIQAQEGAAPAGAPPEIARVRLICLQNKKGI